MAKIIEAKAVISAQDKTGAVFDNIAKKIDQIGRSGKAAEAVDRMAKALERAKAQMAAIERFNASRGGFADARAKFIATQTAVTQAAQAMKRGEGDARSLARAYERAQSAASSAANAFERQKSALISNKRALETMGVPINQAAAHQARLRTAIERTNAALEKQAIASERSHNRRLIVAGAAAYAGHAAAHRIGHGVRETLHTYREFDKERRYGKVVMGLNDEQQKPLIDQAIHMGATTKYNDIQVLEAQRDLAARGLKMDQVMGVITPAANLGQSLDLDLPSAVKQLEGALFGFKRNISTREAAIASARRTADMQVAAAKASGMTPEDLVHLYKFGATPSRLAGLSEGNLLAFGGIAKKANIGGDESGVAFRQLVASLTRPTRVAKEAMLANGLNFKNYQKMPDHLALKPFAENVAAQYGVKLKGKALSGLEAIFNDKALINDPAKFTPAVVNLLKGTLGGRDAKSLKSISGAANRYRDASVNGLDVNALMRDLLTKIPGNLQLANAVFGPKQGGRIATALGDPETLRHILDIVDNKSEGRAEEIAKERMAGFDGAVSRFEGAIMNFKSALGSSLDNGGKGGFLTGGMNLLGNATQWAAEQQRRHPIRALAVEGTVGAATIAAGAAFTAKLWNGFGLGSSAVALDGAAAALTRAAAALGGKSVLDAVPGGKAVKSGSSIWSKVATTAMPLLPVLGAVGVGAGAYYAAEGANEAQGITRESTRERHRRQAAKYTWYGKYIGDQAGANSGSAFGSAPEMSQTMLYGSGVAGDKGGPTSVSVSGEVHGQAEVKFTVEAGSSLLQVVEQSKRLSMDLRGALNSNGPGSAGHSSPDASAASAGQAGAP